MTKTSTYITMGIFDDTAKDDLTVSVSGALQDFSTLSNFKKEDEEQRKWATLEQGRTLLDGSYTAFPDNMKDFADWGLWSKELSGGDGDLKTPIVITLSFTKPHACVGLTFRFDEPVGEWAKRVLVQWYDTNGNVLTTEQAYPTAGNWFLQKRVDRFRKIVVTLYGTAPAGRYLKLGNIDYGKLVVFDDTNIITCDLVEEISQTGDELSYNQLDLQAYSTDEAFNILDPHSMTSGFRQRQKLNVTEYVDGAAIPMGRFYLDEWEATAEHLTNIKAVDIVGVLANDPYPGGVYGPNGDDKGKAINNVGQLVRDILGGVAHTVDSRLAGISVAGTWLPETTKREALRQVAFMCRGIIDTSGDGGIRMNPREERAQQLIDYPDKWLGSSRVELLTTVTGVSVTSYRYTKGKEAEREELFADSVSGQSKAVFSQPYHDYKITGGTIKTANANFVEFTGNGNVVITGIPYLENTSEFTLQNTNLPADIEANVESYEDFTLVTPAVVEAVAENLMRYYNQNYSVTYRKVLTPKEKIASTQEIMSFRGSKVRGNVERRSANLAGGFYSDITVRGYHVKTDWTYYAGECVTGGRGILL